LEDKLEKQLASYGLYEGAWIYSHESLDIVQHQLLNDVPELLYVGIEKKGTTYTIDAVEKLVVKEEEELAPQHLIAGKNGIIQKMFIKKGSPRSEERRVGKECRSRWAAYCEEEEKRRTEVCE